MTEQAAAEKTEDQATEQQPGSEGSDEQNLDQLLDEFDQSQQKPDPKSSQDGEEDEVRQWVREEKERRAREESNQAVNDAVSTIKGDLDVDDEIVKGILYARAEDARFLNAFQNRSSNPQAWNRVLKNLNHELAEKFPKKSDEDYEAARASMRGSTEQEPEDSDENKVNKMSDAEFDRFVEQQSKRSRFRI